MAVTRGGQYLKYEYVKYGYFSFSIRVLVISILFHQEVVLKILIQYKIPNFTTLCQPVLPFSNCIL